MKRRAAIIAILLGLGGVLIAQTARPLVRPLARPLATSVVLDEGGGGPSGDGYLQPDGTSYYLQPDGTSYYLQP